MTATQRPAANSEARKRLAAQREQHDAALRQATVEPLVAAPNLGHLQAVLSEIADERHRQEAKWGQQNHPNGTGPSLGLSDLPTHSHAARADHLEEWARDRCARHFGNGDGTYEHILTEEWAEAIASEHPAELRDELIQVAAVAVAWVQAIDRRSCSYCSSEAVEHGMCASCLHDAQRCGWEPGATT